MTRTIRFKFYTQIPNLAAPNLIQASHPISDRVGCNCANCVQSRFCSPIAILLCFSICLITCLAR
ncbi:hypothetical protein CDG79_00955 [Nostoc sp. 'Peltigera membranacea cyanobiont' 232]|nr:hypothetical protein CDG79_00955 [Nostoc sp. 'Peltigera membranacea cyanobiont' 232]